MYEQETIDDLIKWMRPRGTVGLRMSNRLEAAYKRERGDCAKLREALETALKTIRGVINSTISPRSNTVFDCREKLSAALAAPPRNCDMHTADELKAIFNSELVSELPIANEHEKNLVTITAMGVIDTLFETANEGVENADK